MAGVGELSGEGDSQRSWGGWSSGADVMVSVWNGNALSLQPRSTSRLAVISVFCALPLGSCFPPSWVGSRLDCTKGVFDADGLWVAKKHGK